MDPSQLYDSFINYDHEPIGNIFHPKFLFHTIPAQSVTISQKKENTIENIITP